MNPDDLRRYSLIARAAKALYSGSDSASMFLQNRIMALDGLVDDGTVEPPVELIIVYRDFAAEVNRHFRSPEEVATDRERKVGLSANYDFPFISILWNERWCGTIAGRMDDAATRTAMAT